MKITLIQNFKKAVFTWNNELTECDHVAMGIEDAELDFILENKGHEGSNVEGWESKIEM